MQVLVKNRYALSTGQLFNALMWRELVLLDRNLFLYVFRFIQLILVGVITGTLYLRTRLHPTNIADGTLYEAAIFYSLIGLMFDGFVEMNLTVSTPFHPPWALLRISRMYAVLAVWTRRLW